MAWEFRYGSVWLNEPGWTLVYERYDFPTDCLALVWQRDDLFKAQLRGRGSGLPQWSCSFWSCGGGSLMDELQRAIEYVEFEIRHLGPLTDNTELTVNQINAVDAAIQKTPDPN